MNTNKAIAKSIIERKNGMSEDIIGGKKEIFIDIDIKITKIKIVLIHG
jgi:hypothetical protein